jgi:flagellar assembly factor FliW
LTLNLKAPIVVNIRTRAARQIVVNDDHPLQFVLPATSSRLKKIA